MASYLSSNTDVRLDVRIIASLAAYYEHTPGFRRTQANLLATFITEYFERLIHNQALTIIPTAQASIDLLYRLGYPKKINQKGRGRSALLDQLEAESTGVPLPEEQLQALSLLETEGKDE